MGFLLCQLNVLPAVFACVPESVGASEFLLCLRLNMQITFVHAARVVVYAPPDSIISSLSVVSSEHEHLQLARQLSLCGCSVCKESVLFVDGWGCGLYIIEHAVVCLP